MKKKTGKIRKTTTKKQNWLNARPIRAVRNGSLAKLAAPPKTVASQIFVILRILMVMG